MDFSLKSLLTSIFFSLALQDYCCCALAIPINSVSSDLINDVCARTKNISFCKQTFRSYPNPPPIINLHNLGQISIEISNTTANSTYILIESLREQETDPEILFWLDMCLDTYAYANKAIGICTTSLTLGDYVGVYKQGFIARSMQILCRVEFSTRSLNEPPELVQAGRKFYDLANIIEVIGKLLIDMK
ncbi:hypothetical protein ACH5RR_038820 [Cinchona calisaya]|uniref:Pectinesterase inhibitor domain-containing protein n=1 Tax=Cinchona calisaya TaxID=153742 RepID=A0ABD2Y1N4_9GENT